MGTQTVGGKEVRSMGVRKRPGQSDAERQGREEPKRVVVSSQPKPGAQGRQYAERIFDVPASRGGMVDAAEAGVADLPEDEAAVVAADRQEGGPLIIESDRVLGPGGATRARSRAGAASPVASGGARRRATPPRAQWQSGTPQQQDVVMDPSGQQVQDGTVQRHELITRQEPGPQTPSGQPCTCVFEWEETEDAIEVYVKPDAGMATGLRGAPAWMTWCVVCGGERDGQFRPENAIRYGNAIPEPQEAVDVQGLEARITDTVMDSVAGYLGSEKFLKTLAKAIKAAE